jgi:hypothetical protein
LDAFRVTVPNRNRGSFPESRCLRRPRRLRLAEADAAAVVEVVREEAAAGAPDGPGAPAGAAPGLLLLVEAKGGGTRCRRSSGRSTRRCSGCRLLAVARLGDAEVVRLELAVALEVAVLLRLVFPRRPYLSWIFFLLAESICQRGAV